ncbi:hypothetical protein ND748_18765, partial [Frankia sp. AiPs1]|nr:hypothetical protein [Frankia sp. AiPs1]
GRGRARWRGGARWRGHARRPQVDARLEGNTARLTMTFSVRYPNPVGETAERVRGEVRERVAALAGVRVAHLDIEVPSLSPGAGVGGPIQGPLPAGPSEPAGDR